MAIVPCELGLDAAMAAVPPVTSRLLEMAVVARCRVPADAVRVLHSWEAGAGTYLYHTHVRVPCPSRATLLLVADCFFHAAELPEQPWYGQFRRGSVRAVQAPEGCSRACVCLPVFDFGLGTLHSYRQLLCESVPDDNTRILALRSVAVPDPFPAGTRPAFTLSPTGDVLHWEDGVLHWHHICTVAGVGLLPPRLERWVMNTLRFLRLDVAERRTYREEAMAFAAWAGDAAAVEATWRQFAGH